MVWIWYLEIPEHFLSHVWNSWFCWKCQWAAKKSSTCPTGEKRHGGSEYKKAFLSCRDFIFLLFLMWIAEENHSEFLPLKTTCAMDSFENDLGSQKMRSKLFALKINFWKHTRKWTLKKNMFHYALSDMTSWVIVSKRLFEWLYSALAPFGYIALFLLTRQRNVAIVK